MGSHVCLFQFGYDIVSSRSHSCIDKEPTSSCACFSVAEAACAYSYMRNVHSAPCMAARGVMVSHALAVKTDPPGEGRSGLFRYPGSVATWPMHLGPMLGKRGILARLVGVRRGKEGNGAKGRVRGGEAGKARRGIE